MLVSSAESVERMSLLSELRKEGVGRCSGLFEILTTSGECECVAEGWATVALVRWRRSSGACIRYAMPVTHVKVGGSIGRVMIDRRRRSASSPRPSSARYPWRPLRRHRHRGGARTSRRASLDCERHSARRARPCFRLRELAPGRNRDRTATPIGAPGASRAGTGLQREVHHSASAPSELLAAFPPRGGEDRAGRWAEKETAQAFGERRACTARGVLPALGPGSLDPGLHHVAGAGSMRWRWDLCMAPHVVVLPRVRSDQWRGVNMEGAVCMCGRRGQCGAAPGRATSALKRKRRGGRWSKIASSGRRVRAPHRGFGSSWCVLVILESPDRSQVPRRSRSIPPHARSRLRRPASGHRRATWACSVRMEFASCRARKRHLSSFVQRRVGRWVADVSGKRSRPRRTGRRRPP